MFRKPCTRIAGAVASWPARLVPASVIPARALPRLQAIALVRLKTTDARPDVKPLPASSAQAANHDPSKLGKLDEVRMLIGFTCKVCKHRQYKTMSKNAYERGVVLMQCDGCKSRHLIADNKGWFRDRSVNVEDLMREKGEEVRQLKDMGLLDNIEAGEAQKAMDDYSDIVSKRSRDPK
ncbi:hypothetical protein IWW39_001712 [Coemansia spiralis]|uniref:DNL-type domain-containing protein n=1 Tax=Coemansia spiralis TaxID=417178 RepID=A0A9W8GLY2_9FUNG|nr:hypothetical protein IWW39_001712 [Coemansia spiralis]